MEFIASETPHVAGRGSGAGDPSPYTARGVFRAMQAGRAAVWGSAPTCRGARWPSRAAATSAPQLAQLLAGAGAELTVCDLDATRAARVADETGARFVAVEGIFDVDAEIFAPCAMGQILNEETIPRLKGKAGERRRQQPAALTPRR